MYRLLVGNVVGDTTPLRALAAPPLLVLPVTVAWVRTPTWVPLPVGAVFTVEPGLYFQPDDLTVPKEFRGIGVRIEDDIVVTNDGAINLSAGIPRTADEVEAWLKR